MAFATAIGEGLQSIIYNVATLMLYPVLAFEVAALAYVVFELGRFTLELLRRRKTRRSFEIEPLADAIGAATSETDIRAALAQALASFGRSPAAQRIKAVLEAGPLDRSRVLKSIADGELEVSRKLERTRVLVRFGPILGLMGTLIPISPALVALAQGDVMVMSNNLVIAFSTTVVGLLIGGLGYLITTVRDRWYRQDVLDIEYLLDRLEV